MRSAAVQRLERRATASLQWLGRNLHRFSPVAKPESPSGIKAFSELAILYERLRSVQGDGIAERLALPGHLRRWRRVLVEHCENASYAELARRMPSYAYPLLLPYLIFRSTGHRSPFHEATIRRMWDRGHLFAAEMVPHRVLDREYFLWKAGLLRTEPDWRELYAETTLALAPDALHLDREAAYAITHTLFYLSDWGRRPPMSDGAEAERVARIVDCLLVHYWRLRHWDLLGELLANRVSMRGRSSALVAGASTAFLNAWRPDGCVPGEGLDIVGLAKARGEEREAILFRECYHSTLVGVTYCVTALESRHWGA